MSAPQPSRIDELDALRGLAALTVVLFHFTTRYDQLYGHGATLPFAVPWGHYGVQLFFAISGFVIFMTLDRTRTLADFAVSRFSRLFPAYWTAIGVTTVAVALGGLSEMQLSAGETAVNLTMLQSYLHVRPVDGVYWTLAVELAFYVMMAALYRFRLLSHIEPVLLGWLALKWIWTFAPRLAGFEISYTIGELIVQQYIPFFAIGIAFYRLKTRASKRSWSSIVLTAAFITVWACDGRDLLITALIAAAAMAVLALRGSRLLRSPPLVLLGTVSYSLYLVHQNVGYALIRALEARGFWPLASIAAAALLSFCLAAAITFAIERPALNHIRAMYRRKKLVSQALPAVAPV